MKTLAHSLQTEKPPEQMEKVHEKQPPQGTQETPLPSASTPSATDVKKLETKVRRYGEVEKGLIATYVNPCWF